MFASIERLRAASTAAVDLGARMASIDIRGPHEAAAASVAGGCLAHDLASAAHSLEQATTTAAVRVAEWGEAVDEAVSDYVSADDASRARSAAMTRPT